MEPTGVGLEPDELDGDARLRLGIAVGVYPDVDVIVGVLVPTDLTGRREGVLMVETHEAEALESSVIGEGPEEDLIALPRVVVPDHILIPSKPRGHSGLGIAANSTRSFFLMTECVGNAALIARASEKSVLADGAVVRRINEGRGCTGRITVDMDAGLRLPGGPHADPWYEATREAAIAKSWRGVRKMVLKQSTK